MKVLKHIISTCVWSLLALYLLTLVLLRVPAIQRFTGAKVSALLAEKLGTEVSVGRVDLGFLNRLIIDDVSISDQQHENLLKAARLSVRVDVLPLAEGRISISSAQVFGAHAKLYKTSPEGPTNFQFVIDSLASRDTTSHTPLDLRINSLIVRHSSVSYDERYQPETPGRLNPSHLLADKISTHIVLKALKDDSLNVNIKKLSLTERSGLTLKDLSLKLEAGTRGATLSDFHLQLPASAISIPQAQATYTSNGLRLVKGTLKYDGQTRDSYITPADLSFLMPKLSAWTSKAFLTLAFNGTDEVLNLSQLSLDADDVQLEAEGWLRPNAWRTRISKATFTPTLIENVLALADTQSPELVGRLGRVELTGEAASAPRGLMAMGAVTTAVGKATFDFNMTPEKAFQGKLETTSLQLGTLIGNSQLGDISTKLDVSGSATRPKELKGTVTQLAYKGYDYQNIGLDATLEGPDISGTISIDDPNVALTMEGEVKRTARTLVRLSGNVAHLSPAALHLTDRWGDARFSGEVNADFEASTLNDAKGDIFLDDFLMDVADSTYYLDHLHIKSGYDDGLHFLKLESDFGEAHLKGTFEYGNIMQSITNFVGSKLPTLPGLPQTNQQVKNNFDLTMHLRSADWLNRLLDFPLQLERPLDMEATVNDLTRAITLSATMPAFSYKGTRYQGGRLLIDTPNDTLSCRMEVTRLQESGPMDIGLQAYAANNNLTTALTWDNHKRHNNMSGQLNMVTQLYNNERGKAEAQVHVQPSHAVIRGTQWDVVPSNILYSDNYLVVDRFAVEHDQQHLIIDGVASQLSKDTLTVDLHELEVAYILDLVNFQAVEFSGEATGKAYITSLFNEPDAHGVIEVDHFKFEQGRMGVLTAQVDWNKDEKQIDINAVANDGPGVRTLINGYVSPTKDFIDLGIRAEGTYLDFMHNFTRSFLSSITGHGNGQLRLAGPLSTINLTGQLVVDGEATVTALNTTYQLRQDTVNFIPDDIQLDSIVVYDKYGNPGYLSGGIHHQHLTRLTFDLFVDTDNLLAYDFHDFGDNSFYGTVFAAGNVAMHGRPGEVTIDCNVTPQRGTVFTYNAANPDAIANQEFIKWGTTDQTSASFNPPTLANTEGQSTDIFLNFLINTTPQASMRLLMDARTGDYITLQGDGIIRATFHNKGAFQMFGTYNVRSGTYGITIQEIIKKNFTFNDGGTIVFGGDPYDAALNLQAVHTVSGVSLSDLQLGNSFSSNTIRVNCLMNIGGQPKAPQVTFDLEMPTVNADEQQMVRSIINGQEEMNQQVLYLLGIGRFYNQGQNNAGAEQTDQTQLAMQSFLSGTLSTQINSLLSQVIKNDSWDFGANISTGNEGWHNAEYEGVINGRMLSNRLLINGQFGYRDNATQASPSFIGDFDIRYLFYPNGNLSLKVYNQTNDRYFTRSSLNTQGIGLIMKKDFNGLGELLAPKKRKKKEGK